MHELRFHRCRDENTLILDEHWQAETTNTAVTRTSNLELYVAGKNDGPNSCCLETTSHALNDLETTLKELQSNYEPRNPDWHFSSITVPYQFVKIYYLTFWSDYGVNIEFGVKTEDCQFGRRGIYPEDAVSIAMIPGDISSILDDLAVADVDPSELVEVRSQIEQQELFGHELVPQLQILLQKHGHKWHNGAAQLQALRDIERLSRQAS